MKNGLFSASASARILKKLYNSSSGGLSYLRCIYHKSVAYRWQDNFKTGLDNALSNTFIDTITRRHNNIRAVFNNSISLKLALKSFLSVKRFFSGSALFRQFAESVNIMRFSSPSEWGIVALAAVFTNSLFFIVSAREMGLAVVFINCLLLFLAVIFIKFKSGWQDIVNSSILPGIFNKYCKKNN